jgi:hypothetical protein
VRSFYKGKATIEKINRRRKINILINPRFEAPVLDGRKIHTIRKNFDFWNRFDGKECGIRIWKGSPYRSKQKEICKKTIHVQPLLLYHNKTLDGYKMPAVFCGKHGRIEKFILAMHDGFFDDRGDVCEDEFIDWFYDYPDGRIAVLHFTDYRY